MQDAINHPMSSPSTDGFPLKVSIQRPPEGDTGILVETFAGKSMWFYEIKHILKNTSKILHSHKWSIASAAEGITWPTSDDPVIRLNWYRDRTHDFGGGIGRKGCEIIMPISPTKALYTHIGRPRSPRPQFSRNISLIIKNLICEHALLYIFSDKEDVDIPNIRPRVTDLKEFKRVKTALGEWHQQYTDIEVPFFERS